MVPKHVLIVGGGLAGPALAVSLARQNIRSTIFEIRRERGDSGGSISLAPNALRVLDKFVGVYETIRSSGFAYRRTGVYVDDGYKFGEMNQGGGEEGGYPFIRIPRPAIHKALVDACGRTDGLVNFVWGAKLSDIEEDDEGVTAFFEDGSKVRGDVLIGADGIHSKVRKHVLGELAPTPIFTGSCTVNGFMPRDSVAFPPGFALPAAIFTPIGIVFVIPIDPEGRTIAWGVSQQVAEKDREGWEEYEVSGEAARAAKADYAEFTTEPIRSLFSNIDDAKIRLWVPYSIPDLPTWHTKRVCLIGDAAHALPPAGQGSAQAFEDAALMTRMLASNNTTAQNYDNLFVRFEKTRRQRIERLKKFSKIGGHAKSRSSPWVWYFKKWIIWAFFAWNGFTINDKTLTSYDVMDEDIEAD